MTRAEATQVLTKSDLDLDPILAREIVDDLFAYLQRRRPGWEVERVYSTGLNTRVVIRGPGGEVVRMWLSARGWRTA